MSANPAPNRVTVTDLEAKLLPPFKVMLYNDDVNTMDHVVRVLMEVFHMTIENAFARMIEAHNDGATICKVEQKEVAEFHSEQLCSYSLCSDIQPAE